MLGVWPTSKNENLAKFLFIVTFTFTFFSVFLPQAIRLIQIWGDLDLTSNILSTAELPFTVALIKMIVLLYNKESMHIKYLLPKLQTYTIQIVRQIRHHKKKIIKKLFSFSNIF